MNSVIRQFGCLVVLTTLFIYQCNGQLSNEAAPMPKYDIKGVVQPEETANIPSRKIELSEDRTDEEETGAYPTDLDLKVSKLFYHLSNFEINNAEKVRKLVNFILGASITIIILTFGGALALLAIAASTSFGRTGESLVQTIGEMVTKNQGTILKAIATFDPKILQ